MPWFSHPLPPLQSWKMGKRRDPASGGTSGSGPAPFLRPKFHCPRRTLNFAESRRLSGEGSRRAAEMTIHSRAPLSESPFCPRFRDLRPQYYYPGTQTSESLQYKDLSNPSSTVCSGPRDPSPLFQELSHPSPPSFFSVSIVRVLSVQGPRHLRTPKSCLGTWRPSPLPVRPGTRCRALPGPLGAQEGGTHGSGADPGTGGLPPAPAPAAGSGERGGSGAGNRLDDVTRAGGRRVPQGEGGRGHLEHLGICSPGGAGRRVRH
jgi:hypothetical protein